MTVSRRIFVLGSAQEEFKEIKAHVQQQLGGAVWAAVLAEYRKAFALIQRAPEIGIGIDELKDVGISNVRWTLVRQTRVVYEFNESTVLIHMFIHARRDFRTHLLKRMLSA